MAEYSERLRSAANSRCARSSWKKPMMPFNRTIDRIAVVSSHSPKSRGHDGGRDQDQDDRLGELPDKLSPPRHGGWLRQPIPTEASAADGHLIDRQATHCVGPQCAANFVHADCVSALRGIGGRRCVSSFHWTIFHRYCVHQTPSGANNVPWAIPRRGENAGG